MASRMNTDTHTHPMRKATKAIHEGKLECMDFGQVSVPIFQSSTFSFPTAEEGAARFAGTKEGYIYTRLGNPTIDALERSVAAQENGYRGLATASGMAAITTVYAAFLGKDTHIVSTDCVYGPSRMALETIFRRFGVEATFVDSSDAGNIEQAIRPNTALVFIETPANPTMSITDIAAAAEIAHRHGIPLAVDNTFASPYLQRPIDHGADIVIHSLTKYINGHSDVVGGMIVTKDAALYATLKPVLNHLGGTMDPHQAWLVLRGVQTLPLRMEKSQENAARMAAFLKQHPMVTWLNFPGLPEHPQHDVAKRQMDGFGAMIAFGVRGGLDGGRTVMNSVRLFTLAVSLGGVESLIEHPASMTHAGMPKATREEAGIKDELVRISLGCEDIDDLLEDLDQALNAIETDAGNA